MVATPVALRGFPRTVAETIPVCSSAAAMARDILDLLDDPVRLRTRQELCARAYGKLREAASYTTAIAVAEAKPIAARIARRSLLADFARPTAPTLPELPAEDGEVELTFNKGGNVASFLGAGWHDAEAWGRWMDGEHAAIRLPLALFSPPRVVEFRFNDFQRPVGVSIVCRGRTLTPPGFTTRRRAARIIVDELMTDDHGETVTLDIYAESAVCPKELGEGLDERVLGPGVESVTVTRENPLLGNGVARLALNQGGNANAFLGAGWHEAEVWGRWMDGRHATLRLPADLFATQMMVEIRFCDFQRPVGVSVVCCGRTLTPPGFTTRRQAARFIVDEALTGDQSETVTFDIYAESAFSPKDLGQSLDERVLGAGVESVTVLRRDMLFEDGVTALSFTPGGNADAFLGIGWHEAEAWGRWMDGTHATLQLPTNLFAAPMVVEMRFNDFQRQTGVSIACRGRMLTPPGFTTRRRAAWFVVDASMKDDQGETVTLEIHSASAIRPKDVEVSSDNRLLGAGVQLLTIRRIDAFFDDGVATLSLKTGGNGDAFLGVGWHEAEVWGRWMDGRHATFQLAAALFVAPAMVEVRFNDSQRVLGVSVACRGRTLTPPGLTTRRRTARFVVDNSMKDDQSEIVTLDLYAESRRPPEGCRRKHGRAHAGRRRRKHLHPTDAWTGFEQAERALSPLLDGTVKNGGPEEIGVERKLVFDTVREPEGSTGSQLPLAFCRLRRRGARLPGSAKSL